MKKLLAVLLSVLLASCVVVSRRVEVKSVSTRTPVTVKSPVKAHLKDGSTVLYPDGIVVTGTELIGRGTHYDAALKQDKYIDIVPIDAVLGMESYRERVDGAETFIVTSLATVAGVFGTAALAVAIFGSCPTVYSATGLEEAELFSSSIAPLFEGRDIDRLNTGADPNGAVTLDIRNEAMETHYINHLQLLEVRHQPDERVVPDAKGTPIVVGPLTQPLVATNRHGRDLRDVIAKADGRHYLSERATLDAATAADMNDWIDVTVPVAKDATSAALVFRMRNSLLNTILLYDVMLGPAGAASIDWLGDGLTRISTAVELGRWHQERAGFHVSVWENGGYREVVRVPDSGPISWHDVAAVVPVPRGESQLRVRLSYLADHWRIDQMGVSFAVRNAAARAIPITNVKGRAGLPENDALKHVSAPDDHYLQTHPGQQFSAVFDAGIAPGVTRTFLLSSQGYYTEWIRGSWLRDATVTEPFMPSDDAVLAAMRKWSTTRGDFEKRFTSHRVPVK
ncbi:MAG TPA: hypothetical protein VNJ03_07045 [Vicinamibacterales bacterium]|nr:hypothetical protein [Vicinamibacterales bacterium]